MHPVCGSAEILTNIILVVLDRYCHYNFVCALDSSVGRAEDCSWLMADILRSPVRLRFEGCA